MPPRPAPPSVQRTFAFVDLCSFTDFADNHGDDDAADVLHLLRASLREAATNHGIRVDKWLGDGAMLGVETPAVLAAIVEAKWALDGHCDLPLRGGVAAGPVMVFEGDDYVGSAVNLAAKLCDLAAGGQCLAPAALADVCPVGLAATPIGTKEVPGFTGPSTSLPSTPAPTRPAATAAASAPLSAATCATPPKPRRSLPAERSSPGESPLAASAFAALSRLGRAHRSTGRGASAPTDRHSR